MGAWNLLILPNICPKGIYFLQWQKCHVSESSFLHCGKTVTTGNATCKDQCNLFIGFWTWCAQEELDKQAQCTLRNSALEGARRVFLNPIFPSYRFINALEYKLFLQSSVVTFVKCLLLSPLKVKTMKYYLICNPRKCPETTCLSLESCQNKVRGKVEPENHSLRLRHVAQITGGACGLHSGFQSPPKHLHFFS